MIIGPINGIIFGSMLRPALLFVFLLLIAIAPADLLAQGCSMCKAVAESESTAFGGQQSIGRGLNSGILYLMAVPYVLLLLIFRKRIVGFFKEFASAQG